MGHLPTLLSKCHHYEYKVEEVLNDTNIEHCSERNIHSSIALLSTPGAKQAEDPEGSAGLYQVTLGRMDPITVSVHDDTAMTHQAELIKSKPPSSWRLGPILFRENYYPSSGD